MSKFPVSHVTIVVLLGLFLEPVHSGNVYWSVSNENEALLVRSKGDGTEQEVIRSSLLQQTEAIASDVNNGKIYWLARRAYNTEGNVYRADLDGQNIETFGSFPYYTVFYAAVFDLAGGKLYSARRSGQVRGIFRSDLDGPSGQTIVIPDEFAVSMAIDPNAGKLHWCGNGEFLPPPLDAVAVDGFIKRSDLDGSNVELVLTDPGLFPIHITVDSGSGKIYWVDTGGSGSIRRCDPDGSNVETVIPEFAAGLAINTVEQKIYWVWDVLKRANLDGTQIEVVIGDVTLGAPLHIDSTNGRAYFGGHTIRRVNLDGTNYEANLTAQLRSPAGLAVDSTAGMIYWVDTDLAFIMRSSLTGANAEVLVFEPELIPMDFGTLCNDGNIVEKFAFLRDIDLDVPSNKMYWTTTSAIHRANVDGTAVEETLNRAPNQPIGLTLDLPNGKIYWTEIDPLDMYCPPPSSARVMRANLDGTSVELLVSVSPNTPMPTGIDVGDNGKIYWGSALLNVGVLQANLDGTNVENFVGPSSVYSASFLAVDEASQRLFVANNTAISIRGLIGGDTQYFSSLHGAVSGLALDAPLCEAVYTFGDVNLSGGLPDLDDILCIVRAFSNPSMCPEPDIGMCAQNGIINLDDLLAVGSAFSGLSNCADRCEP